MQKAKSVSKSNFFIINILKGIFAGAAGFIIILSVFSILVLKTDVNSSYFHIFILICAGFSVFIGSLTTSVKSKKSRLINSMITSVIIMLILFFLLLCFNNSDLSLKIYLLAPVSFIAGLIGGIIGTNIKK